MSAYYRSADEETKRRCLFWMAPRRFIPYSPLRVYLDAKYPADYYMHFEKHVTLYQVTRAVLDVCARENLHQPDNEPIIKCNVSLQTALYVSVFHKYQVHQLIERQLLDPQECNIEYPTMQIGVSREIKIRYEQSAELRLPLDITFYESLESDPNAALEKIVPGQYSTQHWELRDILGTIPALADLAENGLATYHNWMSALLLYLQLFRNFYLERTNNEIINCHNSRLGRIFRVSYLHVSQLSYFLIKNLERMDLPPRGETLRGDYDSELLTLINRFTTASSEWLSPASSDERSVSLDEGDSKAVQLVRKCINCNQSTDGLMWCVHCWKIKTAKRKKFKALSTSGEDEDKMCCLCLTAPRDTAFIHKHSCHYIACYACAKEWWRLTEEKKCPKCRKQVVTFCKVYD